MRERPLLGRSAGDRFLEVAVGEGRHRLVCTAVLAGEDVTVVVSGGDRPHVGAVAMAVPRPSLKDPNKTSATASVLAVTGHKDDELARAISLRLAAELSRLVVVVAGVHVDGADEDDIKKITANAGQAAQRLIEALRG
ncbi:MAG: gallate decarboxylase subunit [Clostridia bacterium]|nr:gallate decarboxylase subunit [Clostridia bacterium]